MYWANEDLNPNQTLPDSDLLKAVHVYASNFYDRATGDSGQGDFRSMDGTALIALGVLLEEAAKHRLGEKGHLIFVEGDEGGEVANGYHVMDVGDSPSMSVSQEALQIGDPPWRKRRKLDYTDRSLHQNELGIVGVS